VAFYLMKTGNPYQSASPAKERARSGRDPRGAKVRPAGGQAALFYKILPGGEAEVQG
jgi:hypothetical protein